MSLSFLRMENKKSVSDLIKTEYMNKVRCWWLLMCVMSK